MHNRLVRPARPERRRGATPPACCVARRFRHRSPRRGSLLASGAARLGGGGGGMSTEQRQFTPSRENDLTDVFGLIFGSEGRPYSQSHLKQVNVKASIERDRDSRTRLVLQWNSIDGFDMAYFEWTGRQFVRQLAVDNLAQLVGAPRGDALAAKPNEELRREIALFKRVQAAREAAFRFTGKGQYGGKDVPARLGLGGLQVFTAGRENIHKRPKGYAPWRPHKKTARLMYQVMEILEEYRDHLPLTARQIFYRLVAAYGYPKTESAAKSLGDYLTRARRAEMIPFDQIRDDGISVMDHAHYADENAFYKHIHDEGNAYKRDKLARQKMNMRVYCEAAGMMPQLEKVCEPYSIPVYSCSGFDSVSAKYQLKEACWRAHTYQGRQTVILHLGDYDPSGERIFKDGLVEDIYACLSRDVQHKEPQEVATFERVALKPELIQQFNLPTAPPKDSDSRTKNWRGEATCQLEALPPDVLAGLLDATIKTYLNLAVYEQDLQAEEEERRRITKALPAAGDTA